MTRARCASSQPITCMRTSFRRRSRVVQQQITKSPSNNDMYDLLSELELRSKNAPAALAAAQKSMQVNPSGWQCRHELYARAGDGGKYSRCDHDLEELDQRSSYRCTCRFDPGSAGRSPGRSQRSRGLLQESSRQSTRPADGRQQPCLPDDGAWAGHRRRALACRDRASRHAQLSQHRGHAGVGLLPQGHVWIGARSAREMWRRPPRTTRPSSTTWG